MIPAYGSTPYIPKEYKVEKKDEEQEGIEKKEVDEVQEKKSNVIEGWPPHVHFGD